MATDEPCEASFVDTQSTAQGKACALELQGEKNKESYWVAQENDDEHMIRAWVALSSCPQPESCSKKAFDRASCYSFRSHEQCLKYALQHLTNSSNHKMSQEDASSLLGANDLSWCYGGDSYKDRQAYRDQQSYNNKQQQQQQQASQEWSSSEGRELQPAAKKRRTETILDANVQLQCQKNAALSANIALLLHEDDDLVAQIHQRQANQLANGTIDLVPDITVTSDQIKHIRDNLIRANECMKVCKVRCLELSQNIHREQLVLKDALVAVELMSRGTSSASSATA